MRAHLAAHGVTLALAQILDLLGEVLAVEAVVGRRQGAQHLGLVLRPGIEIVLVSAVRPACPSIPCGALAGPALGFAAVAVGDVEQARDAADQGVSSSPVTSPSE